MRPYLRCVPGLLLAAGGVLASPAAAGQSPPVEQTPAGDEIGSLRRELQSLRDEYTSRIAAIESRLQALEGGRTAPAPPEATPAEPAAAPPHSRAQRPQSTAAVPPGAATGDTPSTLPVYGGGSASSKVFNPDIAVIGNFVGAAGIARRRRAVARHAGGGAVVPGRGGSVRARRLLPDVRARTRSALEEGFITFPTLPGGPPREGRQDPRRLRQGERDARPRAALHRPAARHENLLGGEDGLADSGISRRAPDPDPAAVPRGDRRRSTGRARRSSRRPRAATSPTWATCARTATSASRPTSTSAARSPTATTASTDDTTTRLWGVDATLRWRPLRRSIYTHFLARGELVVEPARGARTGAQAPFGGYGYLEYQFAPALVRRRALRQLRARGRLRRSATRAARSSSRYLAERVQPGARPVPPHDARRRDDAPTSSCSSSCSRSAPTAPIPSERGRHETPEHRHARRAAALARAPAARRRQRRGQHRGPRRPHPRGGRRQGQGRVHRARLPGPALRRGQAELHPEARQGRPAGRGRARARDRLAAAARPAEPQREDPARRRGLPRRLAHREDPRDPDRARSRARWATCTRSGNPHYWLDPGNGRRVAKAIADKLVAAWTPGRRRLLRRRATPTSTSASPRPRSAGTRRWRPTRASRS